jgi:hypothetical protein
MKDIILYKEIIEINGVQHVINKQDFSENIQEAIDNNLMKHNPGPSEIFNWIEDYL